MSGSPTEAATLTGRADVQKSWHILCTREHLCCSIGAVGWRLPGSHGGSSVVTVTSATAWPQHGGSGGHVSLLLQAFAAIMSRQCQGKIGDWGDFYLYQRLAMLLQHRLCSPSAFPLRSSAAMLRISWCPLNPAETRSSIARPLSHEGNLQHSMEVHGISHFFWAENKQVYSYRSEAFLTAVEEETCPKPKFYKVPCRWHCANGTHSSFTGVQAAAAPVRQDPHCPLSPCMKHSPSLKPQD